LSLSLLSFRVFSDKKRMAIRRFQGASIEAGEFPGPRSRWLKRMRSIEGPVPVYSSTADLELGLVEDSSSFYVFSHVCLKKNYFFAPPPPHLCVCGQPISHIVVSSLLQSRMVRDLGPAGDDPRSVATHGHERWWCRGRRWSRRANDVDVWHSDPRLRGKILVCLARRDRGRAAGCATVASRGGCPEPGNTRHRAARNCCGSNRPVDARGVNSSRL
jgi:hypothetical protein